MNISENGVNLIKKWEGFKSKAYRDSVGIWTVGYGQTGHNINSNTKITLEEAENFLINHLKNVEDVINNRVKVPITQNQFDALCSFLYNIGTSKFTEENCTLLRLINQGNYRGAAEEFPKWNRAGGKILQGLTNRRLDERELFLKVVK
jgi:lysozyme